VFDELHFLLFVLELQGEPLSLGRKVPKKREKIVKTLIHQIWERKKQGREES